MYRMNMSKFGNSAAAGACCCYFYFFFFTKYFRCTRPAVPQRCHNNTMLHNCDRHDSHEYNAAFLWQRTCRGYQIPDRLYQFYAHLKFTYVLLPLFWAGVFFYIYTIRDFERLSQLWRFITHIVRID